MARTKKIAKAKATAEIILEDPDEITCEICGKRFRPDFMEGYLMQGPVHELEDIDAHVCRDQLMCGACAYGLFEYLQRIKAANENTIIDLSGDFRRS